MSPGLQTATADQFATRLVAWQKTHGRSSLPWQHTRDPYRVWLSEIMLQQTQVATVLGYYARFLQRFPTVLELAAASQDEVLGLWSGLGYYSRARNLHACAQQVVAVHGGAFPRSAELLQTLPGIGRSTAAAVASFCFEERVAILDGNVRRVLTRVLAYSADLAQASAERALWGLAGELLPAAPDMPAYTQAVMDLGATVCTLRSPQCLICPANSLCEASRQGEPERFPVKTKKLKRSSQQLWLLWVERADGAAWLERRPVKGIWGGLYCLPVYGTLDILQAAVPEAARAGLQAEPSFVHVLTHKDLHLKPYKWVLPVAANGWLGDGAGQWCLPHQWRVLGLPAPVRKLLEGSGA